ncbi:MAG TPA: NAD(P)H-dependent oxidoreductase [Polyangia bacterium]|jgi:NAD(P)H-dependent FMN reductase|nr:NAD(P)H-dependent oxidoreductase [Polyangia bacterium]
MPNLHVVVCSTRPGRVGPTIANWFHGLAQQHGKFEARLVDLAEVNLPLYDEPHHPRLRQYTHEHTKRWSATVDAADAFAFVTPEYNFSPPPALVNALDYVFHEWAYKPCAFVSYGGTSGGLRCVQAAKLMVTTLKMMPMMETVSLPFFSKHVENGAFKADEAHEKTATAMLDETFRWAEALKVLRAK